jgi:hypothetical protein
MKEGVGSIQSYSNKTWVYVPLLVSADSAFPFKKGQKVRVSIKDRKLLVEAVKARSRL